MTEIPTPGSFAHALELQKTRTTPPALVSALQESFPAVFDILEGSGTDIAAAILEWSGSEGHEAVADWLDTTSSPAALVAQLIRPRGHSSLAASLVKETQLSMRPSDFGPHFRQYRTDYAASLRMARVDVAFAFHKLALETGHRRPEIMMRNLEFARIYFRELILSDRIAGKEISPEWVRRYGGAVVMSGRFVRQQLPNVIEACEEIRERLDAGDADEMAHETYGEGLLQQYDLTGLPEPLRIAALWIQDCDEAGKTALWHLNACEVWVKLIDSGNLKARRIFLERARHHLNAASRSQISGAILKLRFEMLDALVGHIRGLNDLMSATSYRGMSFPFGFRHDLNDASLSFVVAVEAIIQRLLPDAKGGVYLYRDICADLLSFQARNSATRAARIRALHAAIELRDGKSRSAKLEGQRVERAQAEDILLLSQLTSNPDLRRRGLSELLADAIRNSASSSSLVTIARDVELRGAYLGNPLPLLLGSPTHIITEVVTSIRAGDFGAIYEIAAERALRSVDLARRRLGGRGQVILVEDRAAVTGQTLVFKSMRACRWTVDDERTRAIAERLKELRLLSTFGVIEHLAAVRPDGESSDEPRNELVTSVRRFVSGETLLDFLLRNPAEAEATMIRTSRYLAIIQTTLTADNRAQLCRREIKEKELGRWLKRVVPPDDVPRLFAEWWEIAKNAPTLTRRDSHSLNWLVQADRRILAADLDCTGRRPFGYELAQLTDDNPVFEASNWTSRLAVLSAYREQLAAAGVNLSDHLAVKYYAAGLIARSVFCLSDEQSSEKRRIAAMRLLQSLAQMSDQPEVAQLAKQIVTHWGVRIGVATPDDYELLSSPERRRISRAMAYHLRHDPTAPVTKDGWIFADDLTKLLRASGHKVTAQQLLIVAGAMGEPRFELEGDEIRAIYGHSTRTNIEYTTRKPPTFLFHGTSIGNLTSIFEARAGLLPMKRRRVHLTSDYRIAMQAAARRKEPIVFIRVATSRLGELVAASNSTWLVPKVPAESLQVVPLWERGTNSETLRTEGAFTE